MKSLPMDSSLINKIANCCLDSYDGLQKTGKPTSEEWTVLSCVVQIDCLNENIEVVSIGTGSKCIGNTQMSASGVILNDSHAEIFARRGFLLYLYDNIDNAIDNKPSIFYKENGRFHLKTNIKFVFFSSQLPCGDASIVPKSETEEFFGDILRLNKRQTDDPNCDIILKKRKLEGPVDIHRTGAKCLPHSEQDSKEPGTNYHKLGQVRTKPGRGIKTLSVSCSDKMAKWVYLGIQGSLLDMILCKPIYISHFIFGASVPYCEESLIRALVKRNPEYRQELLEVKPCFYQCSLTFPCIKSDTRIRPSPCSIVWTQSVPQEVAVRGCHLGVTKKNSKENASLCISKLNLYKRFVEILCKNEELRHNIIGDNKIANIPYNNMKLKSERYIKMWKDVKENFFKTWTVKPDIWNFCVDHT